MSRKVAASVRCDFCPWRARCVGDDVVEVAMFLRRLLIEHVEAEHEEHPTAMAAYGQHD